MGEACTAAEGTTASATMTGWSVVALTSSSVSAAYPVKTVGAVPSSQSTFIAGGVWQPLSSEPPPLAASSSVRATTGQKNSSRSFMSPVKKTGTPGWSARSWLTRLASRRTASSRHFCAGPRASAGLWTLRNQACWPVSTCSSST